MLTTLFTVADFIGEEVGKIKEICITALHTTEASQGITLLPNHSSHGLFTGYTEPASQHPDNFSPLFFLSSQSLSHSNISILPETGYF